MTDFDARLRRALAERYDVERRVGRGGMAVVYLARDLRLGRQVALKVLAPELAQSVGAERFLREIAIAARLNHPRILPLLDSGAAAGALYYAMPFVEGQSLRERLDRDRQLPVEEAVEIALQAAAALAHAHGHGIVHRDIKPGNVLLCEGEALVADFGVARAVSAASGSRLTDSGIAVGTAAYMSPEQASGAGDVDGRSDVYALACVLYEMLAGEPPFTGPTAQAIAARKLSHSPTNPSILREGVPPALGDVILKALARTPADRYQTARLFAEALRRAREPAWVASRTPMAPGPSWRTRAVWLLIGASAALLVTFSARDWAGLSAASDPVPVRVTGTLPPDVKVTRGPGYASSVALSPDGRMLVVAGTAPDGQRLFGRPLDRLEATPLAGTEGGSSPFFSPDGAWIGFFAEGRLRRVPRTGGTPVDIAVLSGFPGGAHWGADDRIVFVSGARAPVYVVDVGGGDAQPLTSLTGDEGGHSHPELLPDGRTLLFESEGWIHALDLASGRRAPLTPGRSPRYAASGHLIFGRGAALLAAALDRERLGLAGPIVPLVEGVAREGTGMVHYALSRSGTLAYVPGPTAHSLVLVGPDGRERVVTEEPLAFENPQFSPEGDRIAVATSRRPGEANDIWIHDLDDGASSRLTFEGGRAPVWTPDGTAVTFSRLQEPRGIYLKRADGRSDAERLVALDEFHWLVGWTPDDRTLAFGTMEGADDGGFSSSSILAFADGRSRRIVGPGSIWGGRLSPDGRWLAYYVLEEGRFDVYVTPFPDGRARWLISDQGGRDPSWSPNGDEIYYRSGDRLMAAGIDTRSGVRVRTRRLVLEPFSPPLYDDYDVHPDGRSIVLVRPVGGSGREIVIVLDWLADVRRAAG